jgi:hypothetical protein
MYVPVFNKYRQRYLVLEKKTGYSLYSQITLSFPLLGK